MKRQAMQVSVYQLRRLADELEKSLSEEQKKLGIKYGDDMVQIMHLVPIINLTPECSDTWELEE